MSIIHASIIPELNEQLVSQEAIVNAIQEIEGELYFMKPETIVVMQASSNEADSISVSVAECIADEVGQCVMRNDLPLVMHIKAAMNKSEHANWLYLEASKEIDIGIRKSLTTLCAHIPKIKYVHIQLPVASKQFPLSDLRLAGHMIGSVLLSSNARIALIAAGRATVAEDIFYGRLQKAVVQNNFMELNETPLDGAAISSFETTIYTFLSAFHDTQFDSRLLHNETIDGSHVMIADLTMS
jgi:hypothetical protein